MLYIINAIWIFAILQKNLCIINKMRNCHQIYKYVFIKDYIYCFCLFVYSQIYAPTSATVILFAFREACNKANSSALLLFPIKDYISHFYLRLCSLLRLLLPLRTAALCLCSLNDSFLAFRESEQQNKIICYAFVFNQILCPCFCSSGYNPCSVLHFYLLF